MRKRVFTSTIAALALFVVVGLVAALAPSITSLNLARAHSGDASLTALTVTAGTAAQTLSPAFSSTVTDYTVHVDNSVAQVTVLGTPDDDGTVAYGPDADSSGTGGHQVNLPTLGGKLIQVEVSHTDSGQPTIKIYTVRVIREGTVATDRAALMALYNSTAGASWVRKFNWASAEPLGMWAGVTTDTNGRVTSVSLTQRNLVGTLPDELGNLTSLTVLHLNGNRLSGAIPASLGNLTSLTYLDMNQSRLSGAIPASLGNLTSLTYINLHGNQLIGAIPDELGNLSNIQNLFLYGNQLSGEIPDSLGNLTTLTRLDLRNNKLSGPIPASLNNLPNVEWLYLDNNQLSGPIPDLSNLTTLTQLNLHTNQLSGPIPDLTSLSKLTHIWLHTNQLSGEIPTSLSSLTTLTHLDLSNNRLSGPIPDLSSLTNLTRLYLNNNQLSGEIPASLGSLTNLTELRLFINQLSGPIPDLSSLTNLTRLYLNNNQLSGEIPASLGNLINLQWLYLNQNQLDGTIPDLRGLTNLQQLSLYDNELTGEIPDSLGMITSLERLYLDNNQLSGPIPATLNSLMLLRYLYLNQNQLSGPIPDLSGLTYLTRLYLNENQLSGTIPATLNSLIYLQRLYLSNNQLDGTIPDLSALTSLRQLYLSNNQLSGPIPAWLGDRTNLEHLYLSNNQLSGEIPAALGTLEKLKIARFASNKDADGNPTLTGCVPLGLRYLVAAEEFSAGVPAQDFIAVDANGDGDTADDGDTPGLNLPFCMLSALEFSDVTLVPSFASGTVAYTASVASTVAATTVTATLPVDSTDSLSIKTGTNSYTIGDSVPLDVGSNLITIEITPSDATLKQTYTVRLQRAGSAATDRAALMALYNSAGGTGWTDKTNWDSAEPLDMWYGVMTDANDRVAELNLPGNNLRGTLPAALGSLTSLTTLDLSGNRLSGQIPDVRGLTVLTSLNLGDNQLSGAIPDWLSSLTSLTTLNLRDNRLTGAIPEELGNLNQLNLLYLDDNQLSGPIPAALGDLNGLQATRFAGNSLTGCVPNGLRYLVTAQPFDSLPAQDFIADDANTDGDTNDVGDTPGLGLPFCTLQSLTLDVTLALEPPFASDTVVYAASAAHDVLQTYVQATTHNNSDTVSIIKGTDTYQSGDTVLLDVGQNVITITVATSDDTPSPHTYTVTVTRAPNTPPTFTDGLTTTRGVDENTVADRDIGDPVAATDTENDTLTYSLDTTSAASFDISSTTGQLQTKADLDFEDKSSYTVTVSVSDSKDENNDVDDVTDDTITVTIQVTNVNEEPEFPSSETGMRSVDENTPAGEDIGAPVTATDDDEDTLTYSLGSSSDADSFSINAASGQLLTQAALDFEDKSSYTVTVTAADPSGAEDAITVTITVNNLEEAGTVTLSSTQPIVASSLTAFLADPDDVSGSVTWSWARSPNGISSWGDPISGATTDSYTPVPADVTRFLRATASYDDALGSGKSAQVVSANRVRAAPTGTNERPMFPSTQTTRDVDENTPAGRNIGEPVAATDTDTLTYSLDSSDADSFSIVAASGQLRTKAALDFETFNLYLVTVTATDTAGEDATIVVIIDVTNVEEPGTVTLSSLQPQVATQLTATLADPDDASGSETWLWERSPNGASDWTLISGETSATYTPVAAAVGDYLRATASYTDTVGPDKSAQAISANAVQGAPGRNKPVLEEHPTATRSVSRNTPAGRNIGAPFTATDADNDALTYSLGGPDAVRFDLDTSSGQLLTKALLTGIQRTSYEVFVSVSDGKDDEGIPEADPQIDTTTEVTINVGGTTITTITTTTTTTTSGGGGGGGGGGSGRATPTPTPTPSPTPTATPTPTGPQFSGQVAAEPSVTATVVPEGTTLGLNGGADLPGGVYVNFPPTAVALPVHVSVSVSNEAPSDVVAPSGTTLLPLTIDITPETPITLGEPLTIEINPTPELLEAAGGDLNNLAVGVVTPTALWCCPRR